MAQFVKSEVINASNDDCYEQWRRFSEFPKFMEHIESVTPTNEMNVWHWKVKSEFGQNIEWDAKWDIDDTNRRIKWHTVNNDTYSMSGNVAFAELGDNKTQVTITFDMDLPGGPAGDAIVNLFANPEEMVENDLKCFKSLMEKKSSQNLASV